MSAIPKQRLLTAKEFAALPREGLRLELVRGGIVAMPPAFDEHGETASRLEIILGHYILTNNLGKTYTAETGFLLSRNPDTVRAPDFAFIETSRALVRRGAPDWVQVIPDLVVEVESSSDRRTDVAAKVQTWLDAGVRMVLAVLPARRVIEVHRPGAAVVTLGDGDMLNGADVVPGFTAPVARIFG